MMLINPRRFFGAAVLLLLLIISVPGAGNAQQHFEGQLRYELTDLNDGSKQEMAMLVKENRLRFLGSLENYAEMSMLSSGLTLRADQNDMLLFSENKKVVVLNMRELGGFLNQMMGSAEQNTDSEVPETTLEQGADTRDFQGMTARQYILSSVENPDDEIHIWASDELYIDWETLMNPLTELTQTMDMDFSISGMNWPMDLTPLYAEFYRSGELDSRLEMTEFEARSFKNNELDIPEGYQQISLFELMMQQEN